MRMRLIHKSRVPARHLRTWATALLIAIPTIASAQSVPDKDTLLLLGFDHSTNADFSLGTATADTRVETTGPDGGRFGGGVDLSTGEGISLVGDDGNFHPAEGTVEFWIKLHWPGNDPEKHSFFNCRMGETGYININTLGNGRVGIALMAGEGDDGVWRRADGDISEWKPGTWHHMAFTWGQAQLHTYIDGQETGRSADDALMPDKMPTSLEVHDCDAVIDDFRVSKRIYTAEDARQSMARAVNPPYVRLTDLKWTADGPATAGRRKILGDVAIPLVIGKTRYAEGITAGPGTRISVNLDGKCRLLETSIGVCPFSSPRTACTFEVIGDGKQLYISKPLTAGGEPLPVSLPIEGVKQLVFTSRLAGGAESTANCVWAGPAVTRDAEAQVIVSARAMKPEEIEMYRRQQSADDYDFAPNVKSPYFVVPKYWEDEVDPAGRPDSTQIGRGLEAFAAPGEYEPVNFVLYAVDYLKDVAIEVRDLKSADGVLKAESLDVRLALRRLMRDLYTVAPHRSTVVSRFLLPYSPLNVPAGTFREYHVIVHVPEDAAAGNYKGTIRIAPANRPAFELPLAMEVLPVRLGPPGDKGYGVYYRFPPADGDWSGIETELADIRRHGGNMLVANLGIEYEMVDGQVEPSYADLGRGLDLLRKHGFHGPMPVDTGCEHIARLLKYDPVTDYDDEAARGRFFAAVKHAMQGLAKLSAEYPEFELMPTHMDEVFGRDRLDRYIRLTEAVRQAPDLRVYITMHNDPKRDVSEMMRRCDPFVDVRCYNGHCMDNYIRAGNSFDDLRRELDAAGDEAWIYHNIRGAFYPAEWTRLVNGYYLWISPLRIHVPWMYYSFKGSPFDATDGPRLRGGDFAYAVPDPNDPARMIPTRHWEGFREGIDDVRYLYTLESLVEKHASTPAAREAATWLKDLRNRVTPTQEEIEAIELESPLLVYMAGKLDGEACRQIRRQAAGHIVRLSGL